MKYDIFKHGTGVRVYDLRSKRYGVVKEIRETGYEWIEPFVLYDGETEMRVANDYFLELEEENKDEIK